jgi:hypothetical protein
MPKPANGKDEKQEKYKGEERRRGLHRYTNGREREVWTADERESRHKIYGQIKPHFERFLDEEEERRGQDARERKRRSEDLSEVFRGM